MVQLDGSEDNASISVGYGQYHSNSQKKLIGQHNDAAVNSFSLGATPDHRPDGAAMQHRTAQRPARAEVQMADVEETPPPSRTGTITRNNKGNLEGIVNQNRSGTKAERK